MRSTALLAIVLAGCSASHVLDDPAQYLDMLDEAECARAIRCEPSLGGSAAVAQSVCHPEIAARYPRRDAPVLVSEGALRYDRGAAEACIAELRDLPCRTFGLPLLAASCAAVFTPRLEEGSSCRATRIDPCAGDSFCATSGGCDGVCAPRAQPGETCAARPCVTGSACAGEGAGFSCGPIARRIGEACGEDDRCESVAGERSACVDGRCAVLARVAIGGACDATTRACVDGSECVSETCRPYAGSGEECGDVRCAVGLRCERGVCVAGSGAGGLCSSGRDCIETSPFCDPASGTCSVDPTGSACTAWVAGLAVTTIDSCPASHRCVDVRCTPIVPLGSACGPTASCDAGLRCVADRCVPIVGVHAPCGADVACAHGLACEEGRCVGLPNHGEACADACAVGECVAGTCRQEGDRALAGEACGYGVAQCDAWLSCLASADDRGICAPFCVP